MYTPGKSFGEPNMKTNFQYIEILVASHKNCQPDAQVLCNNYGTFGWNWQHGDVMLITETRQNRSPPNPTFSEFFIFHLVRSLLMCALKPLPTQWSMPKICPIEEIKSLVFWFRNYQLLGTCLYWYFISYFHFAVLTHYTKAWCCLATSDCIRRVRGPLRTLWCQPPCTSVAFVSDTQKEALPLCPQM